MPAHLPNALCGNNQACLSRLDKRVEKIVSYGNSFGQCSGLN